MIEVEPLIDQHLFNRLVALRNDMTRDEVGTPANVFVPVGGKRIGSTMPRILYVGKATRGFDHKSPDSFAQAAKISTQLVEACLLPGYSAFWQFGRDVLLQVAENCGVNPGPEVLSQFGWSNLVKIGDAFLKEPGPLSVSRQKELCLESLRIEFERFEPNVIVIVTTNYADKEVLYPAFGEDGWRWSNREGNEVAYKLHSKLGLVAWSNHPQGMRPPGTRARIKDFVVELTCRQWRGEGLPACSYADA